MKPLPHGRKKFFFGFLGKSVKDSQNIIKMHKIHKISVLQN